jgi:hypothetical protein
MDPAVATLNFAQAGAIIANMIESYLAAGAPPLNAEGADHAESEDCHTSSMSPPLSTVYCTMLPISRCTTTPAIRNDGSEADHNGLSPFHSTRRTRSGAPPNRGSR